MTETRKAFSRVDRGFVRIEPQPDGRTNVTVLRRADGVSPQDVVCVHLRCKALDIDSKVRLIDAGQRRQSVTQATVFQDYRTKTVTIRSE
ncbi:hypothetical protein [Fodinicola acaciae]|uniref:hypothetical protein n=1 Tax=Fodinicola acaciae TaxID=2681555 RepID=UPI0013D77671|nr:hypothetical protein [Fodinicola acaciae]